MSNVRIKIKITPLSLFIGVLSFVLVAFLVSFFLSKIQSENDKFVVHSGVVQKYDQVSTRTEIEHRGVDRYETVTYYIYSVTVKLDNNLTIPLKYETTCSFYDFALVGNTVDVYEIESVYALNKSDIHSTSYTNVRFIVLIAFAVFAIVCFIVEGVKIFRRNPSSFY